MNLNAYRNYKVFSICKNKACVSGMYRYPGQLGMCWCYYCNTNDFKRFVTGFFSNSYTRKYIRKYLARKAALDQANPPQSVEA